MSAYIELTYLAITSTNVLPRVLAREPHTAHLLRATARRVGTYQIWTVWQLKARYSSTGRLPKVANSTAEVEPPRQPAALSVAWCSAAGWEGIVLVETNTTVDPGRIAF